MGFHTNEEQNFAPRRHGENRDFLSIAGNAIFSVPSVSLWLFLKEAPMFDFTDQVVMITGATGTLGQTAARAIHGTAVPVYGLS